eukprot:COSAG01_NODE_1672_length_9554_cov_4.065785_6_plen_80_part_00
MEGAERQLALPNVWPTTRSRLPATCPAYPGRWLVPSLLPARTHCPNGLARLVVNWLCDEAPCSWRVVWPYVFANVSLAC